MAQSYSARSRAIEPFHVMALLARANELQAQGHDVIHLEIGEPDFSTAAPSSRPGRPPWPPATRYTAARGLPQLRSAISGFYGDRYDLDIDPERILITPGGSGALLLAASLLVDPGRHWLLADPGYPATATSCAWSRAPRNWCRSAPRAATSSRRTWWNATGMATAWGAGRLARQPHRHAAGP